MPGSGNCRKRRVECIALDHGVGQPEILFLRYALHLLALGPVSELYLWSLIEP